MRLKLTKNYSLLLIFLLVLLGLGITILIVRKVWDIQGTAKSLDAKIIWKNVLTGEKPKYEVIYRVVRIQFLDSVSFQKRTKELGLNIDIWENKKNELIGGATDSVIRILQDEGYTVTVLYKSYAEYQKSMEEKQLK